MWLTEQRNATITYRNAAGRLPDVYCMDQDILRKQLGRYESLLRRELNREEPRMYCVRRYNRTIYQIKLMLEAMDEFLSETSGAYLEAMRIQRVLKQADAELLKVEYNPKLQTIDYSSVTESWLVNMKALAVKALLTFKEGEKTPDPLSLAEPLQLMLGENGGRYLTELLNQEKLTDEEYLMIAMALIMKGDDQLIEATLNSCYQYSYVTQTSIGGMITDNVVFEKTEHLEMLKKYMNILSNVYIKSASAASPEEVAGMKKLLQDAMQYNQLFIAQGSIDKTLVTSSYKNTFDTTGIPKIKGSPLITLTRDENKSLNLSWYKYTAGLAGSDYTTLKETTMTISYPAKGGSAQSASTLEGFQYIKSNLQLGGGVENLSSDIGQMIIDNTVAATPVKGADIISSILALMRGHAESISDAEVFNKGMEIEAVGDTLDLFNLFYVSSVKEENGNRMEHLFSVYPSFYAADSSQDSTQKCIENFNINFGTEGRFKGQLKLDKLGGMLTIEQLINEFPQVSGMLNEWKDNATTNSVDVNEATAVLPKGGSDE